jgi:hypothetical protein
MEKILLWAGFENDQNISYNPIAWDISTTDRRQEGYLALFNFLDSALFCYRDLDSAERQIYDMAKRGNAKYAEALMVMRRDRPGESFNEVPVKNSNSPQESRQVRKVEVVNKQRGGGTIND